MSVNEQRHHQHHPVCLLVICGLPGAGKTTLTKKFLHSHPAQNSTCPTSARYTQNLTILLVPFDEVIPERLNLDRGLVTGENKGDNGNSDIHSNQIKRSTLWKEYRQEINNTIQQLLNGLRSCQNSQHSPHQKCLREVIKTTLKLDSEQTTVGKEVKTRLLDLILRQWCRDGMNGDEEQRSDDAEETGSLLLVLDDNMFYRSMRYEYYQLARKYGTGFAQVYLRCPEVIAQTRNQARERRVAKDTIATMATKFEMPDASKAPWEELSVILDGETEWDDACIGQVWCIVEQAFANPAPPYQEIDVEEQERCREASLASVLHQADVVLRKSVSEMMKTTKSQKQLGKEELRQLASTLNNVRTDLLDEVKHQQINLPPLMASESEQTEDAKQVFQQFVRELFIERYRDKCKDAVR